MAITSPFLRRIRGGKDPSPARASNKGSQLRTFRITKKTTLSFLMRTFRTMGKGREIKRSFYRMHAPGPVQGIRKRGDFRAHKAVLLPHAGHAESQMVHRGRQVNFQ
ncbi:MAG: hypothetical protein EBT77_03980, partial [Verrucomicrobia bacterium]|nr:hypothetical protein [Verrucomicrobiota bacterium]